MQLFDFIEIKLKFTDIKNWFKRLKKSKEWNQDRTVTRKNHIIFLKKFPDFREAIAIATPFPLSGGYIIAVAVAVPL